MAKYWVDFAKYMTIEVEAVTEEEAADIASHQFIDTGWQLENVTPQED